MPFRVKCRCGQELVLRYSEWVYLLVGVSVVGFLSTLVAVIVLYSRVSSLEAGLEARADERTLARASDAAPERAPEPTPERTPEPASERTPEPAPERTPEPALAPPAPEPTAEPDPRRRRDFKSPAVGRPTPPWKAPRELRPLRAPSPNDLEADLLAQLESRLHGRSPEPDVVSAAAATPGPGAAAAPAVETRTLLDAPPLVRFLFLDETRTFPVLTAAHLLDPDPRIARLARTLLAKNVPAGAGERAAVTPLVLAVRDRLETSTQGRRILTELGLATRTPPGTIQTTFDDSWSDATAIATGLRQRLPLVQRVDALLRDASARGTDLLLAVDTTRSMDAGLAELKEACAWLLPALEWGAPGLRIALLPYKDGLVTTTDFTETPARDVLPRVLELRSEGGGDVPEGVDIAVRGALELGRFAWRDEADKHIVIVGDAPPRYSELRGLKSLLDACRKEAGFRVHTLGVYPKEGESVPFFAELAKHGGGRSSTCRPGELETEMLLCLFGNESRALVRRFEERLKEEFAGGA